MSLADSKSNHLKVKFHAHVHTRKTNGPDTEVDPWVYVLFVFVRGTNGPELKGCWKNIKHFENIAWASTCTGLETRVLVPQQMCRRECGEDTKTHKIHHRQFLRPTAGLA